MATTNNSTDPNAFLNSIIPGLSGNESQVGGIISNLLNGTPSPSTTRNAAATFGVENGLGTGSGVVNRYGYDLFNEQGQKNQQTGIQDLLNMIQGISSPSLAFRGQNLQNDQFYSGLNQNQNQFNVTNQNRNNEQLYQLLAQLAGSG